MRSSTWSVRSSRRAFTSKVINSPARRPKRMSAARKRSTKSIVPIHPPVGEITGGDIERWFHGLAGLANLVAVGQPTGIDDGTCGTSCPTEGGGKLLHQVEILSFAEAAATTDNDAGVFERWPFAR